jgi:hypothetical protein
MTLRTFRQYALGFGSNTAQVVCQIDGNTIFSGPVTTLYQPRPSLPDPGQAIDNIAWSWQGDADFTGSQNMSLTVTGSELVLGTTSANNPYADAAVFDWVFQKEVDGTFYYEPFSNVSIDGVPVSKPNQADLTGQWWWAIPAGSTFSATLNIMAAVVPPPPPDLTTPPPG